MHRGCQSSGGGSGPIDPDPDYLRFAYRTPPAEIRVFGNNVRSTLLTCRRSGNCLCLIHHTHTKPPPAEFGGPIAPYHAPPHLGPLSLGRWAGGPPRRRVTEPTNRRARKRQENKPALSTLIARAVLGAVRECDVPVPPCSVFRLLSLLSYSHAWPFAVAKATQVCTRDRTSPVAVKEPPPSRDPSTRPLRRSPRHP